MLNSVSMRHLDGVHNDLRAVILRAADLLPPGSFTVKDGLRTMAEQERHVAKGNSKTLNSRHLTGHAVDLLAWRDGRDAWKYPKERHVEIFRPVAAAVKQAADELGVPVEWGFDKWGWDAPHFQLPWKLYPKGKQVSFLKPAARHDNGRFEQLVELVFGSEGGFVNRPRIEDPGGPTNFGITEETLSTWRGRPVTIEDVRALQKAESKAILRQLYWQTVSGPDLAQGLDYALFDFAVHSGPSTAVKILQKLVGTRIDGIVGPVTLTAIAQQPLETIINRLMDARLFYMESRPNWSANARGWKNRVDAVRANALQMARVDVKHRNELALENFTWWQFAAMAVVAFTTRHRNPEGKLKMNGFLTLIARLLLGGTKVMDGKKTATGIASVVLGFVLYGLQQFGIEPQPVDPGAVPIVDVVIGWAKTLLIGGGTGLSVVGLGHKMWKINKGIEKV